MMQSKNTHRAYLQMLLFVPWFMACVEDNPQRVAGLPDLPYGPDLQAAIVQVCADNSVENPLGVSTALIAPGYKPWAGVAGYSCIDVPITTDMVFDIGSIEKNFQAVLVLKLVAERRLTLDDPISLHVPDLPNVDGNATIRQLLDHTSGIFNVFEHPEFPWLGTEVDYARQWELEEVFNSFVLPPYGSPGLVQHYSSTNYLLATRIIEKVTAQSVPSEIKRRFLTAMSLRHTFVSMGVVPTAEASVTHAWVDVDSDGVLEDLYGLPRTWQASLTHPVMFSTASDLVRWIHSLYHDRTVLDSSQLQEMLTFPEVPVRDPEGGTYGLGVVDYSEIVGEKAIGHLGSSLGYSAAALYLPEYGISIAWMINTGESPPGLAARLMRKIWSSLIKVLKSRCESKV